MDGSVDVGGTLVSEPRSSNSLPLPAEIAFSLNNDEHASKTNQSSVDNNSGSERKSLVKENSSSRSYPSLETIVTTTMVPSIAPTIQPDTTLETAVLQPPTLPIPVEFPPTTTPMPVANSYVNTNTKSSVATVLNSMRKKGDTDQRRINLKKQTHQQKTSSPATSTSVDSSSDDDYDNETFSFLDF